MGKISVQDLAKMMGIPNQDLIFKLKSIGVRVEGDNAAIDTDIIQAILQGKKLPHPREAILRDEMPPSSKTSTLRPQRPRTLIQRVEPKITSQPAEEKRSLLQVAPPPPPPTITSQPAEEKRSLPQAAPPPPPPPPTVKVRDLVNDLQVTVGTLKIELNTIYERVAQLEQEIGFERIDQRHEQSDLHAAIADLSHKLAEIEKSRRSASPNVTELIARRVKAAQDAGGKLLSERFHSPLTASELTYELRRRDFYLPERIAKEIIDALESKKIVVLEGVPGTGKSQLARLLADLMLAGDPGSKYTQVSIFPDASMFDAIGGLRMIDNYFAPHLGWLTEAVIKSIEKDGQHWLILDEINRGDINSLLSSSLDALDPARAGSIDHPNLFPADEPQRGSIPIPGQFRIIGTRNPLDIDALHEFSSALARRVAMVPVKPLMGVEEEALLHTIAGRRLHSLGHKESDNQRLLIASLEKMRQVIGEVRLLADREPATQYEHCSIGTARAIEITELICSRFVEGSIGDEALDRILASVMFGQPQHFSRRALLALRDEVFGNSDWAHHCLARIKEALRQ